MPGFDQLNDIPEERRARLLREIRALRAREGLPGPGGTQAGGTETGNSSDAPSRAGQLKPTITHHGHRRKRKPRLRRGLAIVLGAAALAGAGTVLLARPAGHDARPAAAPPSSGISVSPGQGIAPTQGIAPATPSPAPVALPAHATTQIAGIGCPDGPGQDVTLDAAVAGLGWSRAGGGWTGNGCDGRSAWTVGALTNLTSPATLTWAFHPGTGTSRCTLAVYVPTRNALGIAEYTISGSSGVLATAPVNQAANAGQWVTLGTYPVAGPAMTIQLTPQADTLSALATLPVPTGGITLPGLTRSTLPGLLGPVTTPGTGLRNGSSVAASAARATCS